MVLRVGETYFNKTKNASVTITDIYEDENKIMIEYIPDRCFGVGRVTKEEFLDWLER